MRADHGADGLAGRTFDHPGPAGVRAADREFTRGLAALTEYAGRQGGTDVPAGAVDATGFPLGTWVAEQRVCCLEDRLSEPRRAALEAVPGWYWDPTRR